MIHTIYLPIFKLSQLRKYSDNNNLSVDVAFRENVMEALKAFDAQTPFRDTIMVCIREQDGDDYNMSIAISSLDDCSKDVSVVAHSYKKFKNMIFNIESGIFNALERMKKISSFV